MVAAEGSPPSPPPISPTMVEEVGGSPYLELLGHVWNYQLGLAKIGPFPVGSRLSFFLPGCMETDYLRPVCLPDGQAGVVFSFCEESTFGARCCRSTITLPAVQIGSFVARGFIPPAQGGHGACRDVVGPGRDLLILVLATKRTGSDPFSISEDSTHFFVFEVPYGDPPLYSAWSSQRLVDGVAGSQGRLSACSNPPQLLVVSSVCPQEPRRGAHCLSLFIKVLPAPEFLTKLLVPLAAHLHLQECLIQR